MKEEIKFRYWRDRQNRPVVTICEININDDLAARGIAICSKKDNPKKKIGKTIAEGRARKALDNFDTKDPILRREAEQILSELNIHYDPWTCMYKSIFYMDGEIII